MAQERSETAELAHELRRHVALLRSTGIQGLSLADGLTAEAPSTLPDNTPPSVESPSPEPLPQNATPQPPPLPVEAPAPAMSGNFESLEALRVHIGDCTRCPLHAQGRQHIVFGVGNPKAEILFIGEAPGAHEDRQGIPFVGKAGDLLTRIIEGGMKRKREDVYIANVIKCRPPQNRDPTPEEVATCRPFILQQIDLVKPRVIITLGRVATQALLQTRRSITHMRGEWQEIEGIPVMPTFHPAYLLRNPAGKAHLWSDIQEVLRFLSQGDRD